MRFLTQCLIPAKDREPFAKTARERGKTFYDFCARKDYCPVASECQAQYSPLASPYDDIKLRIPVVDAY